MTSLAAGACGNAGVTFSVSTPAPPSSDESINVMLPFHMTAPPIVWFSQLAVASLIAVVLEPAPAVDDVSCTSTNPHPWSSPEIVDLLAFDAAAASVPDGRILVLNDIVPARGPITPSPMEKLTRSPSRGMYSSVSEEDTLLHSTNLPILHTSPTVSAPVRPRLPDAAVIVSAPPVVDAVIAPTRPRCEPEITRR